MTRLAIYKRGHRTFLNPASFIWLDSELLKKYRDDLVNALQGQDEAITEGALYGQDMAEARQEYQDIFQHYVAVEAYLWQMFKPHAGRDIGMVSQVDRNNMS